MTLTCDKQLWGRFLKIERIQGSVMDHALLICEVLVSGYKYRGRLYNTGHMGVGI